MTALTILGQIFASLAHPWMVTAETHVSVKCFIHASSQFREKKFHYFPLRISRLSYNPGMLLLQLSIQFPL